MDVKNALIYKPILNSISDSIRRSDFKLCTVLEKDTFSLINKNLLQKEKNTIFSSIENAVKNPHNILGEGHEAVVFQIENEPYCVRLVKNKYANGKFLDYKTRLSFNLTEEEKINHIAAKLGSGSSIMHKIEGVPLLIPPAKAHKVSQKEVDKAFSQLPVQAFHNIFKQVCYAKKHDMIFDISPANIIMNPKNKTLTAIDFYKMNPEAPEVVRPLRDLYASMKHDSQKDCEKCAGKLILGALEELKPGVEPCLNINEFRFVDFLQRIKDYIPQTPYVDLLKKNLFEIEHLKFSESTGKNVKDELNGRIKVVQAIIKQTFMS